MLLAFLRCLEHERWRRLNGNSSPPNAVYKRPRVNSHHEELAAGEDGVPQPNINKLEQVSVGNTMSIDKKSFLNTCSFLKKFLQIQ